MEKSKLSKGEATSFGFKNGRTSSAKSSPGSLASPLPSVAASVTKETIEPIVIPTLPKHDKGKAAKKDSKANRFGFRPMAPLSNKVADLKEENKLEKEESKVTHSNNTVKGTTKFGYKGSKGSTKPDPLRLEIEQLEESPSVTHKYRLQSQQKRPNEIIFTQSRNKTFSLRDLQDNRSGENQTDLFPQRMTGRGQMSQSPIALVQPQMISSQYSNASSTPCRLMTESTTSVESYGEEKHKRDLEASEKDTYKSDVSEQDEMWGHGEAMALEEGLSCLDGIDQSPGMSMGLRSVLLKIEDPTFAGLAAMSRSSGMLEDEKSPDSMASPDLSCSPPSVEPLPPPPLLKDSPGTPISPTHGSNSCSSDTRDRDFLIDDEIADQPGLVFNHTPQPNSYIEANGPTNQAMASLAGQVSKVLASLSESPRPRDRANSTSLGTLSPCDSLASDDLMVDFETTNQTNNLDDMNEIDDSVLNSELEMQRSQVMKEWNSILTAHPGSDSKIIR